jgi:hypothetical protein
LRTWWFWTAFRHFYITFFFFKISLNISFLKFMIFMNFHLFFL